MSPGYMRNKAWRDRLHAKLIAEMGGRCEDCGALSPLEFAHKLPTGLKGPSRGRDKRLLDVKRNRHAYRLLCSPCHAVYDGRKR